MGFSVFIHAILVAVSSNPDGLSNLIPHEVKTMDEDELNMSIRRFLKKVGINSQREIENAVRSGLASGALSDSTTLKVSVTLRIDSQNSDLVVDGEIKLQ